MTKVCYECRKSVEDLDMAEILDHFRREHPKSERFRTALEDATILVECDECGTPFESEVSIGNSGFAVETYCRECTKEDPLRGVYVRSVDAKEVLELSERSE